MAKPKPKTLERNEYSIDLTDENGRLDLARQLYHRFVEDMYADPAKAKVRFISGIQVALRNAHQYGYTEPLIHYQSRVRPIKA